MDDQTTLLRQVFGESSDDESELRHGSEENSLCRDQFPSNPILCENPSWERVKEINGLWLCRHFLTLQQQQSLLSAIHDEGWFMEASHNQAMRFGDLPSWAIDLSHSIREAVLSGDCFSDDIVPSDRSEDGCLFPILPLELLGREPLFDQLITNLYHPGQGICAHVDLMRFEDGIAIVSLESSCVMHFTPVDEGLPGIEARKVPVYLTPGSLVVMSGEARYLWKHEINRKPGFQMWEGQELEQGRRTSITLRKLSRVA